MAEADSHQMAWIDAHGAWAEPGAGCMQPNRNEPWNGLTPKLFPGRCSLKCKAVEYFSCYNIREWDVCIYQCTSLPAATTVNHIAQCVGLKPSNFSRIWTWYTVALWLNRTLSVTEILYFMLTLPCILMSVNWKISLLCFWVYFWVQNN